MVEPALMRPIELPGLRLRFVVDNLPGTAIAASPIHGLGLFATRELAAGSLLGELDGQLVDWNSFDAARATGAFAADAEDLFMEWNAVTPEVLLVRPFRTKYGFINHNRMPNARLARAPLCVVATRDITAGEEITLDYRCEPLRREYLDKATWL